MALSKRHKRKKKIEKQQKAIRTKQHQHNRAQNDKRRTVQNSLRKLTKRQFDAFCYCRQPLLRFTAEEIAWFEAYNRNLLVVLFRDVTDNDFGYTILGRDAKKMFRCIEVSNEFHKTPEEAFHQLKNRIYKLRNTVQAIYPQDDENKAPNEILIPVVKEEKLHQYFKYLITESRFEAARNIIKEIVYSYIDPDGNYIKEFQTHGFDARLWELYLYIYLHNAGFGLDRDTPAPDYHVRFFDKEFFIEAVTVNKSENPDRPDAPPPKDDVEVKKLTENFMPIKFGSALFSKLQKKYWELDHVKGKPFIIAIHDFHQLGSMVWSRTALSDYLYGVRTSLEVDENGKETPKLTKIKNHIWEGKEIPSGFFNLPDAENISAVIFSNAATLTKFNRMGKLAGLGSEKIKMIRQGLLYNPDPKVFTPVPFEMDVDSEHYEESWSDGLIMYHNPNAIHPVEDHYFSDISHMHYNEDDGFFGYIQPYDVLNSITIVISPQEEQK